MGDCRIEKSWTNPTLVIANERETSIWFLSEYSDYRKANHLRMYFVKTKFYDVIWYLQCDYGVHVDSKMITVMKLTSMSLSSQLLFGWEKQLKSIHIVTVRFFFKGYLAVAIKWMDLENIILTDKSKNVAWSHFYVVLEKKFKYTERKHETMGTIGVQDERKWEYASQRLNSREIGWISLEIWYATWRLK